MVRFSFSILALVLLIHAHDNTSLLAALGAGGIFGYLLGSFGEKLK